jgi:hypothetical protein
MAKVAHVTHLVLTVLVYIGSGLVGAIAMFSAFGIRLPWVPVPEPEQLTLF